MDIFSLYDSIKKTNALELIGEIALEADDFVIFLQQEQLKQGKNEDNKTIGVYTPYTEEIASNYQEYGVEKPIRPKIAGEQYNFEWTGRYFKGMFIKVFLNNNFSIEIDSKVPYADELEKKYKKLLGLIDNNKDKFYRYLEDRITEKLNSIINV